MKRTELERIEREYKRSIKKSSMHQKGGGDKGQSVNDFIERLLVLFRYDTQEIFNINEDVEILETLLEMQENLPAKKWSDVLKKAVKKTGVSKKQAAVTQLESLLSNATDS